MGNRLALAMLAVMAAVAMSSCTSARTGAPAPASLATSLAVPKPLVLVETAYRWIPPKTRYPYNEAVDFAYVVKNPNVAVGTADAIMRVTMQDASGKTFFSDGFQLGPVRPGQTIVGGSQEFPDHAPVTVRFELASSTASWVPAERWEPAAFKPLRAVALEVHRSRMKAASDLAGYAPGHSYFSLTVENPEFRTLQGVLRRRIASGGGGPDCHALRSTV